MKERKYRKHGTKLNGEEKRRTRGAMLASVIAIIYLWPTLKGILKNSTVTQRRAFKFFEPFHSLCLRGNFHVEFANAATHAPILSSSLLFVGVTYLSVSLHGGLSNRLIKYSIG